MRPLFLIMLLFTSCQLHAADGTALYRSHCSACHGLDGQGGVGIPLALAAFQSQSPDEYLSRTIRHGRPGRIMPAFTQLSDLDINNIIKHIRSWQPKIKPPPYNSRTIQGDAIQGKKIFDQYCSNCHGVNAVGGRGTGVMFSRPQDLPIIPPALNNSGFLAAANDDMLRNIILQGREHTPMPSAKSLGVTPQQVDNVIRYLRSLPPAAITAVQQEPAILQVDSPYNYEETIAKVKAAAVGMNFRLIRDQALDDGLVPKGNESKRQMMIYFCNFKFLYDALAIDPRVGLFLPCRVTVIETKEGQVKVMSINPKRLSHIFNNTELDQACDSMHKLYLSILEEATL